VARRRARCPESLNTAPANLQVSKQADGEGQDEEPTKATMTQRPYLLPWVRVLFLIRSITSTDWDDTTGRLVQPLAPPGAGDAPADRA
jgi:hypothetical protein